MHICGQAQAQEFCLVNSEHRKNNSLRVVPLSIIAVSISDKDGEPERTRTRHTHLFTNGKLFVLMLGLSIRPSCLSERYVVDSLVRCLKLLLWSFYSPGRVI